MGNKEKKEWIFLSSIFEGKIKNMDNALHGIIHFFCVDL